MPSDALVELYSQLNRIKIDPAKIAARDAQYREKKTRVSFYTRSLIGTVVAET